MTKKIRISLGLAATLAVTAGCMSTGGTSGIDSADAKTKTPKGTVAPISDKEKKQGAELHPQILQEFGGEWNAPQTAYVVRTGKNIAVQSGLGNAANDFNVSFLNSAVNNAFAIPGGYIYITRQLVALCNSEAEMAGVLGHEVGHVAARHSKKRQRAAQRAQIGAILGTIAGAVLGDRGGILGALGGGLREYSGTLAQVLTLSYSRGQEEEADDLGIAYLSKAGYDPTALSDMLASLALQTAVDQRAAGNDARSIPEWASTHPDPAKRVVRARTNAKPYAASSMRNRDQHLAQIDGMLYDDDPKEGVIEGGSFIHPDLRLKFTVPSGFGMANSSRAVSINGNSGKGLFTTQAYNGDKNAYIAAAFKAVVGDQQTVNYGQIQQTSVNGVPAFYASAEVAGQNNTKNVLTVFAYEFSNSQAFHFVTISAAGQNVFAPMYSSMTRISANEAASIKPRRIDIVTVRSGDTVASIASRMAYQNLKTERFLALNGLASNAALQTGQKVKIVTY